MNLQYDLKLGNLTVNVMKAFQPTKPSKAQLCWWIWHHILNLPLFVYHVTWISFAVYDNHSVVYNNKRQKSSNRMENVQVCWTMGNSMNRILSPKLTGTCKYFARNSSSLPHFVHTFIEVFVCQWMHHPIQQIMLWNRFRATALFYTWTIRVNNIRRK